MKTEKIIFTLFKATLYLVASLHRKNLSLRIDIVVKARLELQNMEIYIRIFVTKKSHINGKENIDSFGRTYSLTFAKKYSFVEFRICCNCLF